MPGNEQKTIDNPEPMPVGEPEMGEPQDMGPALNHGDDTPVEDEPSQGYSEIDDIFSKLNTEKQAAVIKYAKSMVDGDAESEPEANEEDMVNEIANNIMDDKKEKPERDKDNKIRNKKVTVSNPFVSKNFQKTEKVG